MRVKTASLKGRCRLGSGRSGGFTVLATIAAKRLCPTVGSERSLECGSLE